MPEFAFGPDATCGVIVVWTDRWSGRERQLGGGDVQLCEPSRERTRVVDGIIRDEFTGVLLPGAHVKVTSYPAGQPRAAKTREVVSDREARYRICDIPPDHTLTIQAMTADRETPERDLRLETMRVRHDLAIRVAGPGDLVGRIVDRATGRPMAAADITVQGTRFRTQSDELGYFALDDVLPGDHLIEVSHLGFEAVTRMVSIVADRTVDLRVEVSADPIELEPLVVTVLRDRRLEIRGFYDRRTRSERTGSGFFMDQEEIDRRPAATTSSLLREAPGVRVTCAGRSCDIGSSRGRSCRRMNLYLNGNLAISATRSAGMSVDELVRPSKIAVVEVYSSSASAPAEYSGSGRCGAVVIWTR